MTKEANARAAFAFSFPSTELPGATYSSRLQFLAIFTAR